ncbi:ABC transporter substrate-binding protein OS=Streptomyces glaucescens OX=1907 GN=SGLAU_08680 PE=4 SV=1 [Streptomyces glaucescens]
MVPQVGVLKQFAEQGWLKPLSEKTEQSVDAGFAPVWKKYGSVDGELYGLYFKAAHKSTVWYSPDALAQAGVKPPKTYDEMLKAGRTVSDSGLAAFSVAGQDGWTLTDWFENVYLSQAGPEKYDALAAHELKWTDASVVEALTTLGKLFKDKQLIAGGQKGALNTDFPGSVEKVFGPEPEAGMVYEGDFVGRSRQGPVRQGDRRGRGLLPLPRGRRRQGTRGQRRRPGRRPEGGQEPEGRHGARGVPGHPRGRGRVGQGRRLPLPEQEPNLASYGDDVTRATAKSLVAAGDSVRFDMSDQAPAAFGGTKGTGEWKILQDFLRDPSDPKATAAQLEAAAAKAYRG